VIADTCEITRTLFEARHLYLQVDVEPALPTILLDQTRIRQVLLNLLTNAVRFTNEGGVTIRAYRDNVHDAQGEWPCITLSVTDTGIGIDAADLPKLFQEFGQLENVYRWKRGAGLGLFISKQLIEMHGGHIGAESEPGTGTTFFIQLPLISTDAIDVAGPAMPQNDAFWSGLEQRARARRTLLILGDDPKIKRLLTAELSDYDVSWLPADCPEQAWRNAVTEMHPCAIVRVVGVCADGQLAPSASPSHVSGIPLITCSLPGLFQANTPHFFNNYLIKPISRRKLADALAQLELKDKPIRNLLVVDDDDAMREFLRLAAGHVLGESVTLREAGNAEQALDLIMHHNPDTLLLDLNLPDMDGIELAERIHAEWGDDIRIIAVTARDIQSDLCSDQHDTISCMREKPFSRRELGVILGNMIDGFSASAALSADIDHKNTGTKPEVPA
jgi:CheY-like chemotaxis protein